MIITSKEMRPRNPSDFYPTPLALARAAVRDLLPADFNPQTILDPGMGGGVWGMAARERWPHAFIAGVDIRNQRSADIDNLDPTMPMFDPDLYGKGVHQAPIFTVATFPTKRPAYDVIGIGSFLDPIAHTKMGVVGGYDLILGNPPYKGKLAQQFITEAWDKWASPDAFILYLLRGAFTEGQHRYKHFWPIYPLDSYWTCARRPSFTADGQTDSTMYAMFRWLRSKSPVDWLQWNGGFFNFSELIEETDEPQERRTRRRATAPVLVAPDYVGRQSQHSIAAVTIAMELS